MTKLRDLLDLDIDVEAVVEFAQAVRTFSKETQRMSTLTDQMDALVARYANIAQVFATDIPVLQANVSAKVTQNMSDADVTDVQNNLAKLSSMADLMSNLANGLTPPAAITSPVTGTTSVAATTPGAATTAASGVAASAGATGSADPSTAPAGATGDAGTAPAAGATGSTGTAVPPETTPTATPSS